MAQSNKTDSLFRDRLISLEVSPMEDSWSGVQQGLERKATPWGWYGVSLAIAIVLMVVGFLLWPVVSNVERSQIVGRIDHPTVQATTWPDASLRKVPKKTPELVNQTLAVNPKIKKYDSKTRGRNAEEKTATVELQPILNVISIDIAIVDIIPEITEIEAQEAMPIKITYIADENAEHQDRNKLNKMIAVAQKLSPADMLADIRDAKNNLLNRN